MVQISIIAALGQHRELGKNGDLIWRVKSDLARVKTLTTGHPIIMGRKTYESIGRPLPNRRNIIVSQSLTNVPGCEVHPTLDEALSAAKATETKEIFIFGGAQIYASALPHVTRLYLTLIHASDPDADIFFPEYESLFTTVVSTEKHPDEDPPYTFVVLEK